jgi:hypothetical protein
MSETRKLAAILAADVVGYSRLMGEDEAGTAKVVRERREAATPIVRSFGGRLVKTTGDGVLLEFPSVVAAVEGAIAIQKMMAERNTVIPEAKRILYRVGVNLGDILIDGEDILGDGVNVAAPSWKPRSAPSAATTGQRWRSSRTWPNSTCPSCRRSSLAAEMEPAAVTSLERCSACLRPGCFAQRSRHRLRRRANRPCLRAGRPALPGSTVVRLALAREEILMGGLSTRVHAHIA